jgi:hypothetical protein
MFAYPCPSCHQRLLAPAERAGQRTICPKCLKPLTVPTSDARSDAFGSMADIETPDPIEVNLSNPNQRNVKTPEPMATAAPMLMLEEPRSHEAQYDLDLSINLEAPAMAQANGGIAVMEPPVTVKTKPIMAAPLSQARQPVATPAPASQRYTARKPVTQERNGQVHLFSNQFGNVDLAAELSAAISMRMAPPPEPSLDPRFMYVGWFSGVALGISAWFLGVLSSSTWLPYVALSGGAMAVFGLLWRAYLSSRNGNWLAGLVTALPPVCFVQLLRPAGQQGRRPLAFVIAGVSLVGLFFVGPQAKAYVDANIGEKTTDFKITPKIGTYFNVESFPNASAEQQAEILKSLKADANSTSNATRCKALEVLVKISPEDSIPLVVARLSEPDDRDFARTQILQLGATAEPAVLKLLTGASESQQLLACGLLEKIGTAQSYQALSDLAEATASRAVRVESALAADAIAKRIDTK